MEEKVNKSALDDYNPFSDPSTRFPLSETAVLPDEHYNAKSIFEEDSVSGSLPNNESILALERRQAELDLRAAELDRREKEQEFRMASIRDTPAPHNWPPFPSWCPCKPCVRQDFVSDIPFECRWMARMGYGLWLAYTLVLGCNLGGTLAYFIVGDIGIEGPLFGVSILLLLVMPPITFFSWHRPLYKALRSDSSVNYFIFFLLFSIQLIILLIQCLGINYLGACGWINGASTCRKHGGVCALMLIVAACFTVLATSGAFLLFKVHRYYRSSGASFRKAKLEMASSASPFASMP